MMSSNNSSNIVKTAKDLIRKGTLLNDPELIEMGNELLSSVVVETENLPTTPTAYTVNNNESIEQYICTECDYTFIADKPRKKCPQCKKLSLKKMVINSVTFTPAPPPPQTTRNTDISQFNTQVRDKEKSRVRINENGEVEGVYRRSEPVANVRNDWKDEKTEGYDQENERLKSKTSVSPRTRKPPQPITVTCNNCKKKFQLHPVHAVGRTVFTCDYCIRHRRSR